VTVSGVFRVLSQFVAHPNCQQHLTSIWYGPQMGFMQSLNLWKKLLLWIVCVPLMPLFCVVYIIAPDCKVCRFACSFCFIVSLLEQPNIHRAGLSIVPVVPLEGAPAARRLPINCHFFATLC